MAELWAFFDFSTAYVSYEIPDGGPFPYVNDQEFSLVSINDQNYLALVRVAGVELTLLSPKETVDLNSLNNEFAEGATSPDNLNFLGGITGGSGTDGFSKTEETLLTSSYSGTTVVVPTGSDAASFIPNFLAPTVTDTPTYDLDPNYQQPISYPKYIWVDVGTTISLFTTSADTVNFNSLTSSQRSAIASGADLYNGLGGSDVVTLPSVANYNESLGKADGTLNWDSSSTFSTWSQVGDKYTVKGSDGSYIIALGAGSDNVNIKGNGNSTITAGSGDDTITINGNGTNIVNTGSGSERLSISGGGNLEVDGTFVGSGAIGTHSTLELNGSAGGGSITLGGTSATLKIDGASMPTNLISGFVPGDIIDLASIPFDGANGVTLLDSSAHLLDIFEDNENYQLQFSPSQKLNSKATDDFTLSSDGSGGTDITFATNWSGSIPSSNEKWSASPGQSSLQNLADLANNVYNTSPSALDGFTASPIRALQIPIGEFIFTGKTENNTFTYVNSDRSQVVIAISGTDFGHNNNLAGFKNLLTDASSFPTGTPTVGLLNSMVAAYGVLAAAHAAYPNAHITITGHSLGGAIAQLIGDATGYDAVTFNAPGAAQLENSPIIDAALSLSGLLNPVGADPNYLGEHNNYHVVGDGVSLVPTAIGNAFTIGASVPLAGDTTNLADLYTNHLMSTVISELKQNGTEIQAGLQEPNTGLNIFSQIVPFTTLIPGSDKVLSFLFVADAAANLFDPSSGSVFQFTESGTSDPITTVTFLPDTGIAYFDVETLTNGSLAAPITVSAGVATDLVAGTTGFEFEAFTSGGQAVSLPDGYLFDATFASTTQVSATLLNLTGNVDFASAGSGTYNTPSGLTLNVSAGAVASGGSVSGGAEYVYAGGASISTTVAAGGVETVWFGGTTTGTAIKNGGIEYVGSGGVATGTTIVSGHQTVESGGTASSTTVLKGGVETVYSGGVASSTLVSSGGIEIVSAGGTTSDTTVFSGGTLDVLSGGFADPSTVLAGGTEVVSAHGTDDGANISGGKQLVFGVASGVTVFTGSQIVEAGGTASETRVSGASTETVLSGGTAVGATILAGGTVTVSSGGTFEFTSDTTGMPVVRAGATLEIGSGYVFSGTVNSGIKLEILSGGTDSGATVSSGGREIVLAGGTASNTTVLKGGVETVSSGGSASGTMISSGGTVNVLSGDTTFESATVFGGGKLNVSKGGAAQDLTVSSGGALNVAAITSNVMIASGGIDTVSSGGLASSTTIAGGTLQINNGGSDGGNVTFAANTGRLLLDATTFSGTVAGMTEQDTIDLRHFSFAATHVTSSITATSATLTVTDGADIAHIILLGNYIGSTFTKFNDGFGGTSIVDPHVSATQTATLAQARIG